MGDTGVTGHPPAPARMSRIDRRRRGFRGPAFTAQAAIFVPRYVRRHAHKAFPVDWTVRSAVPGRRERKVAARVRRLLAARGLTPKGA